jgi:GUN4-like/Caspase domain
MVKVALLIGVSEFADAALANLPAALRDINAVQAVLNHAEMGRFDEVRLLENPEKQAMEEAIDALFRDRQKDDLVLLYFSGHGIKDDTGKFSLATRITQKDRLRTTAVAASFVHDVMTSSRSRRQVVILDCCFSGAFATGMMAKDDSSVDIKTQLGGEGRAVLTASTATQYAFAQPDEELSVYTRFLVEGIHTGAADTDNDGHITVDELHQYAQRKVQEAAPAMKPEIYAVKEGYTIQLAKAPLGDPTLEYRKEVESLIQESNGEITFLDRAILDELQTNLSLSQEVTDAIEADVLQPYQQRQENFQRYEQALKQAIAHENPLRPITRNKLKRLQIVLKLRDEDVALIADRVGAGLDTVFAVETESLAKPAPTIQDPIPDTQQPDDLSDDLRSDKGIDYTKLRDLLKTKQWRNADYETYLVMLQVVERKKGDWIRANEIQLFPCTDIRTIDQLWIKYSNGHFGFSVQKQIYLDCGGKPDGSYDEKVWEKFGDRVGWRVNNTWIGYSNITLGISAPKRLFEKG